MNIPLEHLIASLLSHRSSAEEPIIPDGVIDLSESLQHLTLLGKEGRVVHSDEPFHMADLLARVMGSPTSPRLTEDQKDRAIFSLAIIVTRVIEEYSKYRPDISLEEVLMHVANQDDMRNLVGEFAAIPYVISEDGSIVPCIALHPLFSVARPITDEMKDGFSRREIAPVMRDVYDETFLERLDNDESDSKKSRMRSTFRKVELDDFHDDEMTADPHNGFDEFYDWYFDNEDFYLDAEDD